MALKVILPFGEKGDVKDLVVTILSAEYPLKIIELTNFIRKRYGKSVTFQAVRKAALQLVSERVLVKVGKEYSINKEWVLSNKKFIDRLYYELSNKEKKHTHSKPVSGEVSVFTFDSLIEMMNAWEDLSSAWGKNFKKGEYNINCYQAPHSWEVLTNSEAETKLMSEYISKGIKSYILCTENTPLDRNIVEFHKKIGVNMKIRPSKSNFDKSYYIGTYGDLIIQVIYPIEIVKKLERFFKKNKGMKELNLVELSKIVNTKTKVKMTVIKNLQMAKHINASIIGRIRK